MVLVELVANWDDGPIGLGPRIVDGMDATLDGCGLRLVVERLAVGAEAQRVNEV